MPATRRGKLRYTRNMPAKINKNSLPPLPAPGTDEATAMVPLCAVFRRYLKSQNLKYTPERADILNAIIERDSIFEVEELLADMRQRGYRASKATAYRTIKLLLEAGIITQALFDAKQSHYQLIYGKAPRDYMLCMKTGKWVEFSDDELTRLREKICQEHGWSAVGHRFQIYGISPEGAAATEHDSDAD